MKTEYYTYDETNKGKTASVKTAPVKKAYSRKKAKEIKKAMDEVMNKFHKISEQMYQQAQAEQQANAGQEQAGPQDDNIVHFVLGGNHDRNISTYGFDPIKVLTEGREDFIHLGYNHSSIILSSPEADLGQFDIHHPDTFDFPIDLTEDGINPQDIEDYLNTVYERCGQSREDSYFDILGHTHKSQFNCMSSYCYIPSFLEGRGKRGAVHVRIYLDEEKGFKYMVFMPLSYNPTNKLVKNNEIIYQKKLSR